MIDANEQLGTVARTVNDREVDGHPVKAIVLAQTYPTDLDDLWEAVTIAERIPRWMMPVSGDLRLGGRFQLEGNAGGTITACDPPQGFDATWEYGDAVSWIEVRLTAVDDERTRLELTHLAHPDEHWDQFGPGATGVGWDLALVGLSLHVRSGTDRPAEAADWAASTEGLHFIVESAHRWREADIAGGEDPATARAAADQTIAAYTQPPDSDS
jgi:uncharacterized protein YndB with AHSA1/START domain